MNIIAFLKDISIIIASWTAIYGIDSWRREYRGKRQAELAEEVLSLFYEAGDAIRHIRRQFAHGEEGSSRKAGENETPDEKKAYDQAYIVFERYQSHHELFNKIHSLRYRFMTQFGSEAAKPFEDLRKIVDEILVAARMLGQIWVQQHRSFQTGEQEKRYFERIQKHESVFWEGLAEEDPITPRLNNCISEMEKVCREILSAKGTLYSFLYLPISFIKKNRS